MKQCARCGQQSLPQAAFCATCGTPFPPGPTPKKPWSTGKVVGVLALIFGGIVMLPIIGREFSKNFPEQSQGCGGSAPGPTAAPPSTPAGTAPPAPPEKDPHDAFPTTLRTGAFTLWEDYHANEVKADEEYKGKLIRVGGVVASVDKDFLGNVVVRLNGPKMFTDILLYPRKSETAKAAAFTKGQAINAICIGDGKTVGSPVLRDCRL